MKSLLVGIKNVLLWSYGRGTWQYDLLCILIIATIFLVPSHYFGDRDRVAPKADLIAPARAGASDTGETIHIKEDELRAFLERQNKQKLIGSPPAAIALYLREEFKRDVTVLDYEVSRESERPRYRVRFK